MATSELESMCRRFSTSWRQGSTSLGVLAGKTVSWLGAKLEEKRFQHFVAQSRLTKIVRCRWCKILTLSFLSLDICCLLKHPVFEFEWDVWSFQKYWCPAESEGIPCFDSEDFMVLCVQRNFPCWWVGWPHRVWPTIMPIKDCEFTIQTWWGYHCTVWPGIRTHAMP